MSENLERSDADYNVRYVPAGIVRAADHECCIEYADEQGQLHFFGFDPAHESGGMLYFPTSEEWNDFRPDRLGQREIIKARIVAYVRATRWIGALERSLVDERIYERFPEAASYLRKSVGPRSKRGALAASAKWLTLAPFMGMFLLFASPRRPVSLAMLLMVGLVAALTIYFAATQ